LRRAHPKTGKIEDYVLGLLREREAERVKEHLHVCDDCRTSITSLNYYHSGLREALGDAVPEVHATKDGLIHNWVELLPDGRWIARHRGSALDGGKEFATEPKAWTYLRRSFREMFPEHRCSKKCSHG
jgi:hypothetical protein